MPSSRAAGLAHAEGVGRGSRTTCLRRTWPVSSWAHLWATQPQAPWRQWYNLEPGATNSTCPFPCAALSPPLPCTHPGRISPRAAPQRTTHRSAWYTPCQRCSQVPSTSGEAGPAGGGGNVSPQGKEEGRRPHLRQPPPNPQAPPNSGAKEGTHVSTQVAPAVCPAGTCHLPEGFLFPAAVPGPCKPSSSPPHLLTWFSQWKPGVTPDPSPCGS